MNRRLDKNPVLENDGHKPVNHIITDCTVAADRSDPFLANPFLQGRSLLILTLQGGREPIESLNPLAFDIRNYITRIPSIDGMFGFVV